MTLYLPSDPRGKDQNGEMRRHAFNATVRVQREVDQYLRVVWDDQREMFVVLDPLAPGGPEAQYVMLVRFDGKRTPVDNRTIETLRKLRFGHDRAKRELEQIAKEHDRAAASATEARSAAVAEGFKWFGQQWTPSVAWDARSLRREQIKKEAGL